MQSGLLFCTLLTAVLTGWCLTSLEGWINFTASVSGTSPKLSHRATSSSVERIACNRIQIFVLISNKDHQMIMSNAQIPCKLVIPSRFISWKTHFLMLAGSGSYQIWLGRSLFFFCSTSKTCPAKTIDPNCMIINQFTDFFISFAHIRAVANVHDATIKGVRVK